MLGRSRRSGRLGRPPSRPGKLGLTEGRSVPGRKPFPGRPAGSVEGRLPGNDGRVDGMEGRVAGKDGLVDGRVEGNEGRVDGIDGRVDGNDGRFDGIDGRETEGKPVLGRLGRLKLGLG